MGDLKIESGCTKVNGKENTWSYVYADTAGIHEEIFVSSNEEKPDIGDFIRQGALFKKTEPQVNSDTSKWRTNKRSVWGLGNG